MVCVASAVPKPVFGYFHSPHERENLRTARSPELDLHNNDTLLAQSVSSMHSKTNNS